MIRVGIIGCGSVSYGHVFNLARIPEARVIAFCDSDLKKARALRDTLYRYSTITSEKMVYDDYVEMIECCDLDAVYILTPHALHFEQAMFALQHDLHVLVEKPMCCSLDQAKRLVEEANRRGKVLLVSYQRHYDSRFVYTKQLIEKKELGDVRMITINLGQDWIRRVSGTWRTDPELGCGGILIDSGSHMVDIVHWVTGLKPVEVFAYIANDNAPVDVYSHVLIRMDNDAIACISINGDYAILFEELEVFHCKEGSIRLYDNNIEIIKREGIFRPHKLPPPSNPDRNFINCILGKEPNLSPGTCGILVAAVTEAAYESAKRGRPVKVNL